MNELVDENTIIDRYTRSRIIFGENFERIQNTKVVVFGVGGVGGFVVDCLYRSGLQNITIVDKDCFDITNQNRQIGSEHINEPKVEVFARLYQGITPIQERVDAAFLERFDIMEFDYIVDAIDEIIAKVEIAKIASNKPYGKYIIATGSAKRVNPLFIRVNNVWKSHGDKFARKLRTHLRKANIQKAIKVIFSSEGAKCCPLGSFSGVTASFGLIIASEIIQDIIKEH
ncbi:tRNA threonylcarbamoyladenosine dehydratase [Helicobacter sp. MIT 03-1614]|uniref:ThiF family adenylyltransferase n=1 Tax=Helicobacter sp. MIT 03-1614 TaxID=1548147 RepID=UPI0010FD8C4F|nr:ThiF family adenylyltransferase [Helicobacter sp. MIT 03-1614]TLD87445.1 tRNA threonylcarbamoyladenosine dehydratase [Helicobacter sp. MIT 03-1614]